MKRVLVWGLGVSGRSAVELLRAKGYEVYAGDDKEGTDFREFLELVDTVVLSPGIPPRHPLWQSALKKGIEIIGELELAYRFFKGRAIAITGTDGKSTTTKMTYLILREHFKKVREGGNTGVPFSKIVLEEPECLAVLEVSSFQGKTLKTFRPVGGAFLNFSEDHLDWHPSLKDYLESKYKIFKNQEEKDFIVLNEMQPEVAQTPTRARKYFFGNKDAYIKDGKAYLLGEELFDTKELKLFGYHNQVNALVSATITRLMGVSVDTIRKVLSKFRGLPFRLEFVGEWKGVKVFNDSKSTTVNALRSALLSMPDGKVILIAGGKDKGGDFESVYDIVSKKVKLAVLIGEAKERIEKAWKGATKIEKAESLIDAVTLAKGEAEQGDIILFSPACASFDMFRDYSHRGEEFNRAVSLVFDNE